MNSMFEQLDEIQNKTKPSRFVENKTTESSLKKTFQNPFVDIPLLRDYLNGDGNNIARLADDRYLSPGQVRGKINATARAITSFLNENIDEELLTDIYKHKKYFLKSLIEYSEKKSFYNPHNFQQNILVYFETISNEQKVLLLQTLEDKLHESQNNDSH
jgi:hypothetical protein